MKKLKSHLNVFVFVMFVIVPISVFYIGYSVLIKQNNEKVIQQIIEQEKENVTWEIHHYLKMKRTFAGYRSEQYDEAELEMDKLKNVKNMNSRIAAEFIYANFEIIESERSFSDYFDLNTPSNLSKIKETKFQNEMKKFRVQYRTKVDGNDVFYGSENPYCIVDGSFECDEQFVEKYTWLEVRHGRNPASANTKTND